MKTGEDRDDGAASFRSAGGLVGASSFANFRFPTHIAFAAIVGWLDLGMFDKHEQAIDVVGQFALKKNERCYMVRGWLDGEASLRRRLRRDDRFFTTIAKRRDSILQLLHDGDPRCVLGRLRVVGQLSVGQSSVGCRQGLLTQLLGVVVDRTQAIEELGVLRFIGIL